MMSSRAMKHKGTPPVCTPCYAMLQSTSTWNSDTCANVLTPLTSREPEVLFVVNSVKLHLTALYRVGFQNVAVGPGCINKQGFVKRKCIGVFPGQKIVTIIKR